LFASSVAGRMPAPLEAVYGASRAFLLSFSEALRSELQDFGVTVAALMPNFFSAKDDPADVARYGFEALMAGDNRVLAGRGISRRTFSDRAGR
jgi:short-subunit dehydrogenase